ncbi:MAG: hypothetical protein JO227_02515 [Acetobacteraceae bacterium]|nr:hypothetical protein [Acetobacteraceae bacterium]
MGSPLNRSSRGAEPVRESAEENAYRSPDQIVADIARFIVICAGLLGLAYAAGGILGALGWHLS